MLNRAVGRGQLFARDEDYRAFGRVVEEVHQRLSTSQAGMPEPPARGGFVQFVGPGRTLRRMGAAASSEAAGLARERGLTFGLTWVAYATYYLGRKGFSVCKADLQQRFALSTTNLGMIDTAYLAAYAGGQFVWGSVGDRLGPRRLVGLGMLAAGLACAGFALPHAATGFFLAYFIAGAFQSTGWPGVIKAMGAAFDKKRRGAVMGAWTTCYQIGGLVATAICTYLLVNYGWRSAFIVPGLTIMGVGLAVLMFLPTLRPAASKAVLAERTAPAGESMFRSPILWSLGGSYFCLKLIRYSLLFWLPFYLARVLHYSQQAAGYQSMSFEIGGTLGAVAAGAISDRYFPGRRRQIASVLCAALAASLLLYIHVAPLSGWLNFTGMALVGFCLFGPDTLVAGAAAQDLGGTCNVARAAGFINGMGSTGAIFQGQLTAMLSSHSWNTLFYAFVVMAGLSCIVLLIGRTPTSGGDTA